MSSASKINDDRVKFDSSVIALFENHRQLRALTKEACGVLIGFQDSESLRVNVTLGTAPGKKDVRRRHRFEIRDPIHQRIVDEKFNNSGGTHRFAGTWHTHPEPNPTPSVADIAGWDKCRKVNPDFSEMFFVIVGTLQIAVFFWSGKRYERASSISFS